MASMTPEARLTADIEGDFVVFLIGMRINRPWKPHRWLPVVRAMGGMLGELHADPSLGLLHARSHFGLPNIMVVQYWRSWEQLQSYASSRDAAHLPAWRAFNRAIGDNGDVGIWHETYLIGPGQHESIYANMPPFGLGRAGQLRPVGGRTASASLRLGRDH